MESSHHLRVISPPYSPLYECPMSSTGRTIRTSLRVASYSRTIFATKTTSKVGGIRPHLAIAAVTCSLKGFVRTNPFPLKVPRVEDGRVELPISACKADVFPLALISHDLVPLHLSIVLPPLKGPCFHMTLRGKWSQSGSNRQPQACKALSYGPM